MQARDVGDGFIIKLARGERVIAALTEFCAKRGIGSGSFSGIGAVKDATLGYYSLDRREYFFKEFPEDMEVASMTGNIALVDGKPFLHTHAVLSRMDESLSCVGAHLKEATVAVTLEVYLKPLDGSIARAYDEEVGLKLLNL